MKNILVLCTGNSARSILAEALFNVLGEGRVRAYSAGSKPKGEPHPAAIALLREKGFETGLFRSKSWDEFALPDAPKMDMVFTVCDSAAGETCPLWPGAPVKSHWGIEDPAAVEGDGQKAAFQAAFDRLAMRIGTFMELPFETMAPSDLKLALDGIGRESEGATHGLDKAPMKAAG